MQFVSEEKKFKRSKRRRTRGEHDRSDESAEISGARCSTAQRFRARQRRPADYFRLTEMKIAAGGVILYTFEKSPWFTAIATRPRESI